MKPQPALFLALLLPTIASAGTATTPTRLTEETRLVWANRDQAGQLLGTSDLFIQSLSPFDRAVRLRSAPPPTTEGFLAFVGQQALDWSEDERKRLGSAFLRIAPRLQERHLPFPKTVLMIKTTGKDEPAPYTRMNAIILPKRVTESPRPHDALLAHELFHILSRNAPQSYRTRLYQTLGFFPCGRITLPPELAPFRITNPDSPIYDYGIQIQHQGTEHTVIPVLLSQSQRFDPQEKKSFFSYLEQTLMKLDQVEGQWRPARHANSPVVWELDAVENFYPQIGGRTYSVFQPDEILAQHFTRLIMGDTAAPPDSITAKLARALSPTP